MNTCVCNHIARLHNRVPGNDKLFACGATNCRCREYVEQAPTEELTVDVLIEPIQSSKQALLNELAALRKENERLTRRLEYYQRMVEINRKDIVK